MTEEALPPPPPQKDRNSRLTTVELIVLIVVLFMLAAGILPALNHAKEKARRACCLGNLKQIGVSMRLYSNDQQERFPTDVSGTTLGSFALLNPKYSGSYQVWLCPSDRGVVAGSPADWTSKNLSFAYGGFGLTESVDPDTPLACDRTSGDVRSSTPWNGNRWTHGADGGNVLYADGHAAFVKTMSPPMYRGKNP